MKRCSFLENIGFGASFIVAYVFPQSYQAACSVKVKLGFYKLSQKNKYFKNIFESWGVLESINKPGFKPQKHISPSFSVK